MDKFEPVSRGGDMDHAEEAFREFVISGGDGSIVFQAVEESFDVVSFTVECPVRFDLNAAISTARDDGLDVAAGDLLIDALRFQIARLKRM